MTRNFLTRVPESHLAKFFMEKKVLKILCRTSYMFKTGQKSYFIDLKTGLSDQVLKILNVPVISQFQTTFSLGITPNDVFQELRFYGIKEFDHFKKSPGTSHFISWNQKTRYLHHCKLTKLSFQVLSSLLDARSTFNIFVYLPLILQHYIFLLLKEHSFALCFL